MKWALAFLGVAATGCVANIEHVVAIDARVDRCDDASALASIERGLSDYGTWSEDDTYGTIWTPNDEAFVPYATDGRFADVGGDLVWTSDVAWGTTLHHGRWVRCKERWRWVPGSEYGGAWVTVRHEGDRTSWAPMPPTRIWRHGVSVPITAPDAPVVGSRSDDELALVPPDPPPARMDAKPHAPSADEESDRKYREIGQQMATLGDEASTSFDDDGFGGDGFVGGGGGHGSRFGGRSTSTHGGGAAHSAHSSGRVSSHAGGHSAHAVGHH